MFCPGLEKGTVLLEGKGHGAAWGKRARCCLGEKGTVLLGGKGHGAA